MKLFRTILLSLVVFLFGVGVHQTMLNGFLNSYWIFMLVIIFLGALGLLRSKESTEEHTDVENEKLKNSTKERNPSHKKDRHKV